MTLVFHKAQAIACGANQLFLISPFVGRILDWFKRKQVKIMKTLPKILELFQSQKYITIIKSSDTRQS